MPYVVYILYSEKDKKLYVGCTTSLEKRLVKHHQGGVSATMHRRPLLLVHHESIADKGTAFNRERFLKSLWGAREKQQIKNNFLKQHKA